MRVEGLKDVQKLLSTAGKTEAAERTTETYAKKMAQTAASNAPRLNGYLAGSLADVRKTGIISWSFGSNLPYATRQEFEHRTKKAFARGAVWEHEDAYKDALKRNVMRAR